MMISDPREADFETSNGKITTMASSSNSTPFLRLKDPRIVCVSREFGGKDRHSKVCTVRGVRDRRVRLSVPTAIQLYNLQDKLGLNQPSKVIDWLLNATKHDIDELPPLPISPLLVPSHALVANSQSNKQGVKLKEDVQSFERHTYDNGMSGSSSQNLLSNPLYSISPSAAAIRFPFSMTHRPMHFEDTNERQ